MYIYLLFCSSFLFGFSRQSGELIDSRLKIEKLLSLDSKTNDLTLIFTIEQGLVGHTITSTFPITGIHVPIAPFSEAYFDFKSYRSIGPQEVSKNGEIYIGLRRRFEGVIICQHNNEFPFDKYSCTWKLVIRGKSKEQLDLRWATQPLETEELTIPDFILENTVPSVCTYESSLPSAFTSTTTHVLHGCISVLFDIRRSLTIPLTRFFVPTSLALFLSWLSFYTRRSDLVVRVILPISSIIIQLLLALSYLSNHPASTTLTPADVWCILLTAQCVIVILLLFLISLVESKSRKYKDLAGNEPTIRKQSKARHHRYVMKNLPFKKDKDEEKCLSLDELVSCEFRKRSDSYSLAAVRIQIIGRILCPLIFIVSTCLFFLLYLVNYF